MIGIVGLAAGIGLAAGAYPALVLSRYQPAAVLKGRHAASRDGALLRRGLVIAQFVMAIFLITGTLFVRQQLSYIQTKDLGFDKEHVVIIPTGLAADRALPIAQRFRTAVEAQPNVTGFAYSAFTPNEEWLSAGYTAIDGSWRTFAMNWTSPDYLDVMGMRMLAGRPLDADFASDSTNIVVNETLLRDYNWESPEAALGRSLPGAAFPEHEVVGVVADFHFASLREEIRPLVLTSNPNRMLKGVSDVSVRTSPNPKISVRIRSADLPSTIRMLERTWKEVAVDLPFEYSFLDQAVDVHYREDRRLAGITGAAAGLAILIACLGIFGLATLSVARRTKEIGVRKTMGASTTGIALLLSKEFLRLVLVAFLVAAPLTWLAVDAWLRDFAYRTDVDVNTFVFSGLLAVIVALGSVGFQAIRGARLDPVQSLRYE